MFYKFFFWDLDPVAAGLWITVQVFREFPVFPFPHLFGAWEKKRLGYQMLMRLHWMSRWFSLSKSLSELRAFRDCFQLYTAFWNLLLADTKVDQEANKHDFCVCHLWHWQQKKKGVQHLNNRRGIRLNDMQNGNFTWTLGNPFYLL